MRVMTLGALQLRGLGDADTRSRTVLFLAPVIVLGTLGLLMFMHKQSFRR